MLKRSFIGLFTFISVSLLVTAQGHSFFNDLSRIVSPERQEVLALYTAEIVVEFIDEVKPESFRAWLNGRNITDRFEETENGMWAVVHPEDGLRIGFEGDPWYLKWNILSTKVRGTGWERDYDFRIFYVEEVDAVTVPNLLGLSQTNAESEITTAGLTVGAIDTANSDTVPESAVISQSPSAGASVAYGSTVDLVVSLGPAMVTVPDVEGMSQTNAEASITAAGLTVGVVAMENNNTVSAGNVINQNPVGGALVPEGSSVKLVVSIGPVMAPVSDVVGLPQAEAEAAIVSAGFTVGTVSMINSATVPAGDVISQNPVAGVLLSENSPVNLEVSLGPVMIIVPDLADMHHETAESIVVAFNLTVGEIIWEDNGTVQDSFVISQVPASNTMVAEGSPVDLVVSLGPATDNDIDGIDDAVEDGAPNNGDGNNDGTPDRAQANVASFPNAADGGYVTLIAPQGTTLAQVAAVLSPGNVPAGVQLPVEFFSFKVQGLTAGAAADVTLLLAPDVTLDTYYKFGPTPENPVPHWYEFLFDGTTGAEILAHSVILHFVDGRRGDDDLNENGEISEPGGPAILYPVDNACASGHELTRGETFSCELPVLVDEFGQEIETPSGWDFAPGASLSSELPTGLGLVEIGAKWYIQGTVAQDATLESRTVNLGRLYPDSQVLYHLVTFNIIEPLRVWTQNSLLRPNYPRIDFLDLGVENTQRDNNERTRYMVNQFSKYGIVALQEVFDPDNIEQLEVSVDNYYRSFSIEYGPEGDLFDLELEDSGLMLLVNDEHFVVGTSYTEPFDDCVRYSPFDVLPSDENFDCLAAKGFSITQVFMSDPAINPDNYIYVVNTHTQAGLAYEDDGEETEAKQVRVSQFQQLSNAINFRTDPAHPVIIMGDLNVYETDQEHDDMLNNLTIYHATGWQRSLDSRDDLRTTSFSSRSTNDPDRNPYARHWFGVYPDNPKGRLDYILLRQGTAFRIDTDFVEMTDAKMNTAMCRDEGWLSEPGIECYLSDHYGLAASLKFSRQKPEIRSPQNEASFSEGEEISLHALYTARSDTFQPVNWLSNISGAIGTQTTPWFITVNGLPVGTHIITAQVNDPLLGLTVSDPATITIFPDSDNDGLNDGEELNLGTDPNNPDTDGDGINDGLEVSAGTNPLIADTDFDGLSDGDEINRGTNPANVDTDSDGVWDGVEVILLTDPASAASTPTGIPTGTLFAATARGYLALIDPTNGLVGHIGQPSFGFGFGLEFDNTTSSLFIAQTTNLAIANLLTADATAVGPFTTTGGDAIDVINMAFDPISQNMYGVEEGSAPDFLPTGQLLQIDQSSGTVTRLGSPEVSSIHALTFRHDGILFAAVDGQPGSDRLVEMNPATGEVIREIGLIGYGPVFGLTFDQSGALLATAINENNFETDLLAIYVTPWAVSINNHFEEAVFDLTVYVTLTDNGDGTVTQARSDGSTLMWLKDANFAQIDGFDTDGRMTWLKANAWITYLNTFDFDSDGTPGYANYSDWRLPKTLPVNGTSYDYNNSYDGSTDQGYNITSPNSELAYMFYVELGYLGIYDSSGNGPQSGYGLTTNTGPFTNLQQMFWSGTEFPIDSNLAWAFAYNDGHQLLFSKDYDGLFAWAVRDGG